MPYSYSTLAHAVRYAACWCWFTVTSLRLQQHSDAKRGQFSVHPVLCKSEGNSHCLTTIYKHYINARSIQGKNKSNGQAVRIHQKDYALHYANFCTGAVSKKQSVLSCVEQLTMMLLTLADKTCSTQIHNLNIYVSIVISLSNVL